MVMLHLIFALCPENRLPLLTIYFSHFTFIPVTDQLTTDYSL